jgi:hypothetical protein
MPPTRYGLGPLQAIEINTHEVRTLFPAANSGVDWDRAAYPNCSAPPQMISTHGLSVRPLGGNRFRLHAINHGGRASVEIFDVAVEEAGPQATWRGCVEVPTTELGVWPNGIAALPGGGFVLSGYSVATWRPEQGWRRFEDFQGSRPNVTGGVGYANGVEVSPDGRFIYIADMRHNKVFRFPVEGGEPIAYSLNVNTNGSPRTPDNLRWGEDGLLYAAGPIFPAEWSADYMANFRNCFLLPLCVTGISVVAINTNTGAVHDVLTDDTGFGGRYGLTATALQINDEIWLNSERSHCLAVIPRPRRLR